MAMPSVIRKASPKVVPLALRAIASPRILNGGSFTNALTNEKPVPAAFGSPFLSNQFSTVADAKKILDKRFAKVLKSEIQSAKRLDLENKVPKTPPNFPFVIEDEPCENFIKLRRDLDGETIEVLVRMPSIVDEEEVLDDDDEDDITSDSGDEASDVSNEDENKNKNKSSDDDSSTDDDSADEDMDNQDESLDDSSAPTVPMTVTITKENGNSMDIFVLASSDEIIVQDMLIKESSEDDLVPTQFAGPNVKKLAFDVKYSLRKYLEIRGIKETNMEFLYKYMVRKSKRDDMLWLRKLKKFVRN